MIALQQWTKKLFVHLEMRGRCKKKGPLSLILRGLFSAKTALRGKIDVGHHHIGSLDGGNNKPFNISNHQPIPGRKLNRLTV